MLQELLIRNFALIDELRLQFPAGLNLITGETGAGKSIVIDALGLALGERASGQDVIRAGADKCLVEAVFDLRDAPPATLEYLRGEGLLDDGEGIDGDTLLVTRELTRAGRNQCRINGRLMPVAALREATDGLVDVHGQHEHQTLLASERHLDLLDSWLGADALKLLDEVQRCYSSAGKIRRDLSELRETAKERARNLDLYKFQQEEISGAGLTAGEEDEMTIERTRLMNAEKLHAYATDAYNALNDAGLDGLNSAVSAAQKGAALDPELEPGVEQLTEALNAADEARRTLRAYRDNIEFNPDRLEEIEERLALIRTLKRKYGETVEEIIAYGAELAAKLDLLENSDEREATLTRQLDKAEADLISVAKKLSAVRQKGSKKFGDQLLNELRDLGMAQSRFEVQIAEQPVTSKGIDHVEFLISPNPGEPLKPLAKVASGGELSRVMLSLKTVLSRTAYVPTMIFDEIDVGVGGRTALTIAQKLEGLSRTAQVFCITHLPQIASQPASAHFFIEKRVEGGRTTVHLTPLDPEQRVDEIARMLGGGKHSQAVLQTAREMLHGSALAPA